MQVLENTVLAAVQGAGYWVTKCDIFGCYNEYIYDVAWESGYWAPAEWVNVYDPFYGDIAIYSPATWVDGGWVYY